MDIGGCAGSIPKVVPPCWKKSSATFTTCCPPKGSHRQKNVVQIWVFSKSVWPPPHFWNFRGTFFSGAYCKFVTLKSSWSLNWSWVKSFQPLLLLLVLQELCLKTAPKLPQNYLKTASKLLDSFWPPPPFWQLWGSKKVPRNFWIGRDPPPTLWKKLVFEQHFFFCSFPIGTQGICFYRWWQI